MKKLKLLYIIMTCVFIIATIITFIIYMNSRDKNGEILLVDMELVGGQDMYAKVDVSFISGRLAKDKNGKSFYFVGDDEHLFMYATSNELSSELNKIMEYSYNITDIKPKSYRVIGRSVEIPEELKTIALKAYNELFKEQTIQDSEFDSYIGSYYLDEEEIIDNSENSKLIYLVISIILMFIFAILLIISII